MLQLDRCPGTASFLRHYLFRVAENLAVDRIRQRYSRSRLDQLTSIDDLFPQAAGLMQLSERMVRKYITRALIYIRLRREGHSAKDAWNKVQS